MNTKFAVSVGKLQLLVLPIFNTRRHWSELYKTSRPGVKL